jgi:hypothetical protein
MFSRKDGKTPQDSGSRIMSKQRLHRPYASMNWIRFNGSPRCLFGVAISQPLVGTPLVNA